MSPQRRSVVHPAGRTVLRPLPPGATRLTAGLLAERQRVNREVSLRVGAERMREAGTFRNFDIAAGQVAGPHGHENASDGDARNFVDSDVYKWLEAVAWTSAVEAVPPDVEAAAQAAIDSIGKAQDADGYLNTWYQSQPRSQRFSNLAYGHEMYCLGHLIQAAVAFARTRGDGRLLDVARRFADLVVREFGPAGRAVVCGHPEIEMAMVELYREIGAPAYLDFARAFVDRRGRGVLGPGRFGAAYYQDRLPFRSTPVPEGHAVRALYLMAGAADVAIETGDSGLLDAALRQWTAMAAGKTYITGGVGARHEGESFGESFELPPDTAYCETCAAIASVMASWRLLLATGEGRFADLIERTILNAVLVGVSQDGRSFAYDNPLDVRTTHPREPWFEIACCPPNVMRLLGSVDQYMATGDDAGIQVHLYGSATIDCGGRSIRVATDYPADGRIDVEIVAADATPWALSLRIPGWCRDARLSVNSEPIAATAGDAGYVSVRRVWRAGDRVRLILDVSPRLTVADARVDAVRGRVAVERGPVVYCLESGALPAGAEIGLLSVIAPGEPEALPGTSDGWGPEIAVRCRLVSAEVTSWPYRQLDGRIDDRLGQTVVARLVPYATWGQADAGPMRVWLPSSE
jgi:DUF1680 family protein